MPKMKSHKGTAKRYKKTGSGKWVRPKAGSGHHLEIKSSSRKRRYAGKVKVDPVSSGGSDHQHALDYTKVESHLSLFDGDDNAFYSPDDIYNLSPTGTQTFVGFTTVGGVGDIAFTPLRAAFGVNSVLFLLIGLLVIRPTGLFGERERSV